MPDYLALYSQLGAPIPEETWIMPTDDCNQLFDWDTGYINPDLVPIHMKKKPKKKTAYHTNNLFWKKWIF